MTQIEPPESSDHAAGRALPMSGWLEPRPRAHPASRLRHRQAYPAWFRKPAHQAPAAHSRLPYGGAVSSDSEGDPPVVAPAGPALGPVPLRLTLDDPPRQLLTGSRIRIVALETTGADALAIHCGVPVGLMLEGGPDGPIVGGVYGGNMLLTVADFRLARRRYERTPTVRRADRADVAAGRVRPRPDVRHLPAFGGPGQ
jgi:hypothetical protein